MGTWFKSHWRLVVPAILFICWVGWLGFLAVTTANPVVLRRPQILVSQVDVCADVAEESGKASSKARIDVVYWPKEKAPVKPGQDIAIVNLPDADGWQGAGQYIIPMVQVDGVFKVAPIPRSPGFTEKPAGRIYPFSPDAESQIKALKDPQVE